MGIESLKHFFILDADQLLFVEGTYNYWSVSLSILISIFASWISLYMLSRFSNVENKFSRLAILFTSSLSMGGAVWSMHFIGMMSFELCTKVTYHKLITILSILPSLFASYFALRTLNKKSITKKELIFVGILVGAGIGFMHYMGMAAMEMRPKLLYDPYLFLISLVVAISLAILSILIQFRLKETKLKIKTKYLTLISGIVMGSAISGMHYTGMAAARFVIEPTQSLDQTNSDQLFLAALVSFGSFFVIGSAVVTIAFISYKDLFQNLLKSESRLRAIIETAADAIVLINTKGIIQEFNITAEKMFGWKAKEVIGQNVKILMPDPFQRDHDHYLSNYLRTGEAKIIGIGRETIAIRKDGTTFPIRLAIGHTKLPQDDIFVGLISDISERVVIENALKENEEQLKSFIQNIPGIVYRCLVDEHWTSVFISDSIFNLTGYPASDFLLPNRKRTFNDIIHPEDRIHVSNIIQNAIDTSDTFVLNYRIVQKTGDVRWVLEYGGLVLDESKKVKFLDGVILDNTDRRMIEEALIESKEKAEMAAITKTTFLANMSHEIRTPMNAILGFTEILLAGDLVGNQKKQLETVKNSAKSLLRLLNDVLNSAKLDKGAVELEIYDFSLVSLVDQVCSAMSIEAKRKGLRFQFKISEGIHDYYRGDSLRIRQILTNLIGNAIKFTKDGFIQLNVSLKEGEVLFHIEDSGIGIASDILEKIFDPFTQADVSMSRKFGGTGLGTTISKQLVELMKGKIWVKSEFGVGTHFFVSLPLEKGNPVLEINETIQFELPNLKILIVDDVKQNVELIQLLMTANGHEVEIANNGREALEFFKSKSFDLVLMDIQMPEMDGLEATRQIRLFEKNKSIRIPILALSASVFEEDRISAKDAGMDGFVSKPIDIQDLFLEIRKVINVLPLPNSLTRTNQTLNDEVFRLDRGIQLFGSIKKYKTMLNGFFLDFQDDVETWMQPSLDHAGRQTFLHRLKGVSSNLGIVPLSNETIRLEKKLHSSELTNEDLESLKEIFSEVYLQFQSQFSLQQAKDNQIEENHNKIPNENLDQIRNGINTLKKSFSKGSYLQDEWRMLHELLHNTELNQLIIDIESSISQFDFDTTVKKLNNLEFKIFGELYGNER
ncbi:PAS domain S-box protein [Leptospira sp. 2 VSF19]|uniref:Sensor protein FixL n=1 Tax=Leptospira soteropolitanensis TaxID=2950025 RepID=A0AAW5VF14_9LEPT|nr:PAS domain S-box protein [Leptospira soteropolitanensis]MCW7492342.1 PAS domain S-box protein [Leptospira soteropolitanensis]MCW7499924.1 PAS domain S-box protein [Leptospira soteropolitanensis]MCW7522175.1 PAS domain S-box protein [Leptospira soteropolitanensis]MCW7526029.1 PAS domain S-box protein [Leptospira soteropolitanensis]MCW7529857.1 PAS domain S-box protein [Leptospira soteropolitanensis]